MPSVTITIPDDCGCCFCGFSGFVDPTNKYRVLTYYDDDDCRQGPNNTYGTVEFTYKLGPGGCYVEYTAITGDYNISGAQEILRQFFLGYFPTIISDTRSNYYKHDHDCGNPNGDRVYIVLSDPIPKP
jgi:hypothetical protein